MESHLQVYKTYFQIIPRSSYIPGYLSLAQRYVSAHPNIDTTFNPCSEAPCSLPHFLRPPRAFRSTEKSPTHAVIAPITLRVNSRLSQGKVFSRLLLLHKSLLMLPFYKIYCLCSYLLQSLVTYLMSVLSLLIFLVGPSLPFNTPCGHCFLQRAPPTAG